MCGHGPERAGEEHQQLPAALPTGNDVNALLPLVSSGRPLQQSAGVHRFQHQPGAAVGLSTVYPSPTARFGKTKRTLSITLA